MNDFPIFPVSDHMFWNTVYTQYLKIASLILLSYSIPLSLNYSKKYENYDISPKIRMGSNFCKFSRTRNICARISDHRKFHLSGH
jgi:hypothetical protein